jgi:FemAB-related protein (PEP-CTERM system-associated)
MLFRWVNREEDGSLWDQALKGFPDPSFSCLYGWRGIYEGVFKLKTYYLMVEEEEQILGLCPLVYMRSPWLGGGNFLLSLPYMTRGGVMAQEPLIREAIIARIVEKAREVKADFVELRELAGEERPGSFPANQEHVQMVLSLPDDWRDYEKAISPRLRQVKRAQKAGLEIRWGRGEELLADFYAVFSRRMRELFFPVYPKKYFGMILERFKDQARLALVYDRQKPLGGMLLFTFGGTCSAPYVATLVQGQGNHPNQLLYYTAIRQAWEEGYRTFDFCRSQVDSGTFIFKSQWKAKAKGLIYYYPIYKQERALPTVGQAQKSLTFRLAEMIWPRLPLPLTQWLGEKLIRQLALA